MGSSLKEIKSFLDVTCYHDEGQGEGDIHSGLYPFVTISREHGAGGRALATALMGAMERHPSSLFHGWRVFDRQMCEGLIHDEAFQETFDAVFSERCHSEVEALVRTLLGARSSQPAAFSLMFQSMRKIATCGKVIIVGRSGCCVTASLPLGVHVRLVAPEEYRIQQAGLKDLGENEARRELHRRDRDRERLMQTYFRRNVADVNMYDAVWNTSRVPMDSIARAVMGLIESRAVSRGLLRRVRAAS
ncbi:MAG: cytidylate kinase family protein [Acidobacteriota bacterium]